MIVTRVRSDGDVFLPQKNRKGQYVLGDPKFGKVKHHAQHKVFADTLDEAIRLVERKGFSLWMKGQKSKQTNLISPNEIKITR